jgi:membrane-bound ClpP family serine protease
MCHIVLILPILGLSLFWFLDFSLALPLYIGLVVLSGGVVLLTVQALRKPASSGIEGMRGDSAEVVEALRPHGTVRYHNTFWYAKTREPIAVGETVRIVGNTGICLMVEKVTQAPSDP